MAQIRLTQKQLQSLKLQLYGKASLKAGKTPYTIKGASKGPSSLQIDVSYLKKDIFKIIGFSLIALLIQLAFYLGIQYRLISF